MKKAFVLALAVALYAPGLMAADNVSAITLSSFSLKESGFGTARVTSDGLVPRGADAVFMKVPMTDQQKASLHWFARLGISVGASEAVALCVSRFVLPAINQAVDGWLAASGPTVTQSEPTMREIIANIRKLIRDDQQDAAGAAFLRAVWKPALFVGSLYALYLVLLHLSRSVVGF